MASKALDWPLRAVLVAALALICLLIELALCQFSRRSTAATEN